MFNVGSPYNVPAGSQVNIDHVIHKYKEEAYKENRLRLFKLRINQIRDL